MAEGRKIVTELGVDKPVQDVDAAIAEIKKRGAKKVAVTGFCWGGTITWLAATRLKPDAAIGYYGGGIHGAKAEKPTVPTMLHFGDKDIPMTHVNELRKLHPDVQIFDYPADHGFHCDERGSYDAAASKQAMARTLEFMKKHVG
jgi:carboxymethylenebutenolidase